MTILIDNYDSFSYNLYQLVGAINPDIKVIRNDEFTCEEIESMKPDHIIISPGPGRPSDAGMCEDAVRYFAGKVPILGVCLGHQGICEVYGCTISHAKQLMHGKKSRIHIDNNSPIFKGLDEEMDAARYHSLVAVRETVPDVLQVIGEDKNGEVMAVQHKTYPVYGLQFHPESILTPQGRIILENFLDL